MENIWEKCPRSEDVLAAEREALAFLEAFGLSKQFPLEEIEAWIYHCPSGGEANLFDPVLSRIEGGTLADLNRFDDVFRKKLFAHVPQKMLGGLSPVKYTLRLKQITES